MVTGYNICPICKKKYSPYKESKYRINKEPICLKCYYEINKIKNIKILEE